MPHQAWHLLFCALVVCALVHFSPLAASAALITIPTVGVGNVGNPNDPSDGDSGTAGVQNFGAVAYAYNIGTTEVTNAQYVAFLNEKAKSDPLGLYNASMGSNNRGGITQSGVSGSFTYAIRANMGNKPVNFVSWYDSIRFANWLNNGQGAGDTETGAYTILGGTATPSNATSITRNSGATWFLTSENEWYKAAYYQPAAQGGDSDNYWLYPTRTNSNPTVAAADVVGNISNPGANVVNFNFGADWNAQNGNVTTVGSAGPLSESFYGTSDQAGNAHEWNEALISGSSRSVRGGGSNLSSPHTLQPSFRSDITPTNEGLNIGFRVATVPEPSTGVLGIIGCGLMLWWRKRRK